MTTPETLMDLERRRQRYPQRQSDPQYCEQCGDLLPPGYHLRLCKLCRDQNLERFNREKLTAYTKPKTQEW